jgi:uncharacterized membrane protein
MLDRNRDLVGACLWAVMALVAATSSNSVFLRVIACAPLVFLLPGYALLRALDLAERSVLAWYAIAIGLSVAITIIGGFLLNAVHSLTPIGWALWLGSVTAGGAVAEVIGGASRDSPPRAWQLPGGIRVRHVAFMAVAAFVVAEAFAIMARDQYEYRQFHYTEFWMLLSGPERPGMITIGLRNVEASASDFDIEMMLDGRRLAVWRSLPLEPGQTWIKEVNVPIGSGRAEKAEAWLFKSDNRNLVYRKVSVPVAGG